MKTLNFIKRKHRGAGGAQPGPDNTVGGKVWALTGSVTKLLSLLELELDGLQGCVMSARPVFPTGSQWVPLSVPLRPCPTSRPPAGSHRPRNSCESDLLAGAKGYIGQTQLGGDQKILQFWGPS